MRIKQTRSERREEHRRTRIQRAIAGASMKSDRKKISRGNGLMLIIIVAVFLSVNFLGVMKKISEDKVLYTYSEFENGYSRFINEYSSKFDYSKDIENKVTATDNQLDLIQSSSNLTGNYISIITSKDRNITDVVAMGEYDEKNRNFPVGFKENMLLVTALVLDYDYNKAEDLLIEKGLLNEEGNLFLQPNSFKIGDFTINFNIIDSSFQYRIFSSKKS